MGLFSRIKQKKNSKKEMNQFREELNERLKETEKWKKQNELENKIFDNSYPYFKMGEELSKKGHHKEALKYLNRALKNGYKEVALYHRFTIAYRALKMYDEEIHYIDMIISDLDDEYTQGWKERKEKAIKLKNKQSEELKK